MAILHLQSGRVAGAGTFSPSDWSPGPRKKYHIQRIVLGLTAGTTGTANVRLGSAGNYYPLVDDYPLSTLDKTVSFNPDIAVDESMSLNASIETLGAADTCTFAIYGRELK